MTIAYTVFDTAIGHCGLAWSERGIVGVQLPERDAAATGARLAQRFPGGLPTEPPSHVARAIEAIRAILAGEERALDDVALDLSGVPPFHARVYAVARAIPRGRTTTYGEIATRLGDPTLARAVGQALGRNPFAIVVPCHRVVGAAGWEGGFSAAGGLATKRRLLEIEGAREPAPPSLFD
ncbi:MAG TPA: methylated-DNA--[protein]-cysteine S-methyltransferase [Gemmatimonadaceae bacterium]|nr:methylated-DNA--[protein]-cysteine S-methyltransferase [Gemmatimonadaceae bacterium]